MRNQMAGEVERAMAPLTDREKEVMRLRYGLGTDREHTLETRHEKLLWILDYGAIDAHRPFLEFP